MRARTAVAWGLVVGWMLVIFLLSAQPGGESSSLSDSVVQVMVGALDAGARAVGAAGVPLSIQEVLHVAVRKSAHFFAYLALGALIAHALATTTRITRRVGGGWQVALLAWLAATAYAATDEFHQLFVPGRAAQATDVLIDSIGALLGVWLYLGVTAGSRKRVVEAAEE